MRAPGRPPPTVPQLQPWGQGVDARYRRGSAGELEISDLSFYLYNFSDDSLLNDDGFADHWKGKNGLYSVGLSRRGFFGANRDAQNVANDIKSLL
ncbi:hypothetical protein L484_020457 [Morus notabilis]|uniref:Uncharacterized protein n=1 Tax=Morus notabilis TaxID=981085 RepID=W9SZN9_9ROSA|nr:hypothetical protein L484_020457 [Morus notabilis]